MQVTREKAVIGLLLSPVLAVGEKGHLSFKIEELPDIMGRVRDSALKLY